MKKTVLLLLLISFSLPLFAQKGGFIGLRVIPQSAWILNQDDFDSDELDFAIPFSVAAAISGGYMFTDAVGIEAQLLFSPQGQKYIDTETDFNYIVHNNYFKIPLLFRFRAGGEKVAFLFNAGPELGFLISSNISTTGPELDPIFSGSTKEYFENFEFSVAMGLGTSISLGSSLQLEFLVQLNYGLSEIESEAGKALFYDYQNDGRAKSNNAVAGFSVGLNYCFGGNSKGAKEATPVD